MKPEPTGPEDWIERLAALEDEGEFQLEVEPEPR